VYSPSALRNLCTAQPPSADATRLRIRMQGEGANPVRVPAWRKAQFPAADRLRRRALWLSLNQRAFDTGIDVLIWAPGGSRRIKTSMGMARFLVGIGCPHFNGNYSYYFCCDRCARDRPAAAAVWQLARARRRTGSPLVQLSGRAATTCVTHVPAANRRRIARLPGEESHKSETRPPRGGTLQELEGAAGWARAPRAGPNHWWAPPGPGRRPRAGDGPRRSGRVAELRGHLRAGSRFALWWSGDTLSAMTSHATPVRPRGLRPRPAGGSFATFPAGTRAPGSPCKDEGGVLRGRVMDTWSQLALRTAEHLHDL
jgi:hypothetical protein